MSKLLAKAARATVGVAENTLIGQSLQETLNRLYGPTLSAAMSYDGEDKVTTVTYYSSSVQTVANRVAQLAIGYQGSPNTHRVGTETWTWFSATDGTTVLKTITRTYSYNANDVLQSFTTVTT